MNPAQATLPLLQAPKSTRTAMAKTVFRPHIPNFFFPELCGHPTHRHSPHCACDNCVTNNRAICDPRRSCDCAICRVEMENWLFSFNPPDGEYRGGLTLLTARTAWVSAPTYPSAGGARSPSRSPGRLAGRLLTPASRCSATTEGGPPGQRPRAASPKPTAALPLTSKLKTPHRWRLADGYPNQ